MHKKLTVALATYDDFDGVFFTVQSLRLHHRPFIDDAEILILNNHPEGEHHHALHAWGKQVKNVRVVDIERPVTSFTKYRAFDLASHDVVLVLDCHVLLEPGFLSWMMAYWDTPSRKHDMLTGPLIYNDLDHKSTHMEPKWCGHDYGGWATNAEGLKSGLPFEVPMQGMGCFAMLKESWFGIPPDFVGFGAEEWFMAEMVRQHGGRVMCHPFLGWLHRFDWPKRTFPLRVDDRLWNYYRGWHSIYQSLDHPKMLDMDQYWATIVPEHVISRVKQRLLAMSLNGGFRAINSDLP